jgi:WhiB family redox-sensing transcriptional regulator
VITEQAERHQAAARKSWRRKQAVTKGRNPALADSAPRPAARITISKVPLPRISSPGCAGKTDLFFSRDREDIDAARFICRSCPGRTECLASAMARGEESGVWGGADLSTEPVRRDAAA